MVAGDSGVSFAQKYAPQMTANLSSNQMLIIHVREYFVLVGWAIGWLSLAALFFFSSRTWAGLPKLVVAGCFVGAVAAFVMVIPLPVGFSIYALPPVIAAVALLLRAYLAPPSKVLEAGAPKTGAPLS